MTSSHKQVTHPSMTGRFCGSGQRGPKCSFGLSAIPHLDRRGHAPSAVGLGLTFSQSDEACRSGDVTRRRCRHSPPPRQCDSNDASSYHPGTGTQQDGGLRAMRASEFGIMETRRINSDKEPTEFPGSSESLVQPSRIESGIQ